MQRAWLVLLAGCGFESNAAPFDGSLGATIDAAADTAQAGPPCWSIAYNAGHPFNVSVCPTALASPITIAVPTTIDTDAITPNDQGLVCAPLTATSTDLCAIAASSITLAAGVTLAAHGNRPLALIAHSIDIEGTLDVASHAAGQLGPASNLSGCELGTAALGNGGGQGGTFDADNGGQGGDGQDSTSDKGGGLISSIGIAQLRGGCPGGPSSNGGAGGRGGGAVWLSVDAAGTLTIGQAAIINASGASGQGGVAATGKRGGYGGGSGGMILLQAPTLIVASTTGIFANGGGGGGGAAGSIPGNTGFEPVAPTFPGAGGLAGAVTAGGGGGGYPTQTTFRDGNNGMGGTDGGGGGGGGAGTIWVAAQTTTGTTTMSPAPLDLLH